MARRDGTDALFAQIKYGELGDFERAVLAAQSVLEHARQDEASDGAVDKKVAERFIEAFRSERAIHSNEWFEELIERACENYYDYQVLELMAHLTPDDEKLPALKNWRQQSFLGQFVPPPRPRGRHKSNNYFRDRAICTSITRLKSVGFSVTRNKSSKTVSACDVLLAALTRKGANITFDAVEQVWMQRDRLVIGSLGVDLATGLGDELLRRLPESKPE